MSVSEIQHPLQFTRRTPTKARRSHKKDQCLYRALMPSQKTSRRSDLPRKVDSMFESMRSKELNRIQKLSGLLPVCINMPCV